LSETCSVVERTIGTARPDATGRRASRIPSLDEKRPVGRSIDTGIGIEENKVMIAFLKMNY
jgi:hypothetical protein